MNAKVIGLIGFIGSGKGTVGDILADNLSFQRESFAKPLKDVTSLIFGWDRQMVEGATTESRIWREKEDSWWSAKLGWVVTPRAVLQKMGTEAGRNVFGEALWTSALINRLQDDKYYVITDVRFENEILALKSIGATLVRVDRGQSPDWAPFAVTAKHMEKTIPGLREHTTLDKIIVGAPAIHRSEWDWFGAPVDYLIQNDGTLKELTDKVVNLARDVTYGP